MLHNIKFAILAIFKLQLSGVKYIQIAVQPISRTFLVLQNWNTSLIKQYSILSSTPKDGRILIPATFEYFILHGKVNFVDAIEFLRWGDYFGWVGFT